MSKNETPDNQEVDLGQLFNSIGRVFQRLFDFINSILKFCFNIVIASSKAVITNFKVLVGVVIISGILGFALEKFQADRYESSMLVKTYFDSKYQLDINLGYYNNLISDERYEELANIFNIETETAKNILEFELLPGPENENTKLQLYDKFVSSIDSIRAQEISYEDYLDNRDIFAGDMFYIRVEALDKDIYGQLDAGVTKSFENLYSTKKMKKRDSMLLIRKQTILESIAEIDSLQNVYINVLEEESQATKTRISLGEGFPLQQEKSKTNEYQLLNKEIQLRDELRQLEEEGVEEDEFYDIISTFQQSGTKVTSLWTTYSIILPVLALFAVIVIYLVSRYVKFVKEYEL
ncbi:MAG: hypothetical protein ACWA5P_09470 [bacterium]